MSGMPAPRPVTDFGARIAAFAAQVKAVQQQLTEALSLAGFRRDPYRHIIEADVAQLDLYPEMLELMDATRQPFRPEDLKRLQDAAWPAGSSRAEIYGKGLSGVRSGLPRPSCPVASPGSRCHSG